jgi:phospholipase C
MSAISRRNFLTAATRAASTAAVLSVLPPSIRSALAIKANNETKSINDVKHIVILMQENRSFDHYFGTLRGVRGFGDRFPIPLESGKPVWFQSDGAKEIPPFHFDKTTMNAALIIDTPHNFPDTQGAWNQGKYGYWPMYKTATSMGYYRREEAPFQYALAEAFTICDAYHCSLTAATDPNRTVFFSGSNYDPVKRAAGQNCTPADAEIVNLRCWTVGAMPTPGYTYRGSALTWPTIPEVLEQAGITWRIYQDPNDNWTGAMNGCLAFQGFRDAVPDSPIYKNGLSLWTLDHLKKASIDGTLPSVSWILPSKLESEHPAGPSSAARGGDFTQRVLEALIANPDTWSKTVLFVTFDENDGLFDHVPPPAIPSYNLDGTLAGKSTIDVSGMYFADDASKPSFIDPRDTVSGHLRPWGMGPRVPMYVISPWSKGGWVASQVFDHTSVGQFIEKRFGITIPAISPWSRAVSGDLTSAFDFVNPNDQHFPTLPDMSDYAAIEAASQLLPTVSAPAAPQPLFQEPGTRYSRALPYELYVTAVANVDAATLNLIFRNGGDAGAVFHVYDGRHLDRIPRRYTVESGKQLSDDWDVRPDAGIYALNVYGPNGYFRSFKGTVGKPQPEICVHYERRLSALRLKIDNSGADEVTVTVAANAYRNDGRWTLMIGAGGSVERTWSLVDSGRWYDFTVIVPALPDYERRVAGRVENGEDGHSDPASAVD